MGLSRQSRNISSLKIFPETLVCIRLIKLTKSNSKSSFIMPVVSYISCYILNRMNLNTTNSSLAYVCHISKYLYINFDTFSSQVVSILIKYLHKSNH